jgi:hypothetical protein
MGRSARALVRGRLHSEARVAGVQEFGGGQALVQAGSQWCQAGSPPSGVRRGPWPLPGFLMLQSRSKVLIKTLSTLARSTNRVR